MKNIIKKYRGIALLTAMLVFSIHINAVFEGRSEELKKSAGIRTEVELAPIQMGQKAENINPGGGPTGLPLGETPLELSGFSLLLGVLAYCMYIGIRLKCRIGHKSPPINIYSH